MAGAVNTVPLSSIKGHITEVPWLRDAFRHGYASYLELIGGRETRAEIMRRVTDITDPVTISADGVLIDGEMRYEVALAKGAREITAYVVEAHCWRPRNVNDVKTCVEEFLKAHARKDTVHVLNVLASHLVNVYRGRKDEMSRSIVEVARKFLVTGRAQSRNVVDLFNEVIETATGIVRKYTNLQSIVNRFERALAEELGRITQASKVKAAVVRAATRSCLSTRLTRIIGSEISALVFSRTGVQTYSVTPVQPVDREEVLSACAEALAELTGVDQEKARDMMWRAKQLFRNRSVEAVSIAAAIAVLLGKKPEEAARAFNMTVATVRRVAKELQEKGFRP